MQGLCGKAKDLREVLTSHLVLWFCALVVILSSGCSSTMIVYTNHKVKPKSLAEAKSMLFNDKNECIDSAEKRVSSETGKSQWEISQLANEMPYDQHFDVVEQDGELIYHFLGPNLTLGGNFHNMDLRESLQYAFTICMSDKGYLGSTIPFW